MTRPLMLCLTVLATLLFDRDLKAQDPNPTHVCPHYIWGSSGSVYHWYSAYLRKEGADCETLDWNNYDGGDMETTGGSCENLGACQSLAFAPAGARASKAVLKNGLTVLPEPTHEPSLKPIASVMHKRTVDVMIQQDKVLKVKLYLILVDPRRIGHPLPAIIVANGFEVRYDIEYPPYLTVPYKDVKKFGDNRFLVRIGDIGYTVTTHEEGSTAK